MKNIILLVIILPFLTSCNDKIQENDRLNSPEALTQTEYDMAKSYLDVNTIPQLPVEAWFLAAREFEHNNKDITDSAQYFTDLSEYLDTRLTELFPQEAYIGMMADIENYYDNFLVVQNFENDGIQDTIFEVNEFDNSMFFLEFDSIIVEHDLHSWGPDADSYLSYFYGLDTMANVTYTNRVSLDDLFTYADNNSLSTSSGKVLISPWLMRTSLRAGAYLVKAAIVLPLGRYYCNWETKQKFGLNSISEVGSKPANAFQHSFTSFVYRLHLGWASSQFAMWQHEYFGGNPCNQRHIDLHNNKVGNLTRYWRYRGSLLTSKYFLPVFANNAFLFITHTTTGTPGYTFGVDKEFDWSAYISTQRGSQDCKTCKKDRKGISQFFIYIEQ